MEEWRDIVGFEGYQVSSHGRVRTFWKRKHYPTGYGSYSYLSDTSTIMPQSDDGNGYMKLMLYDRLTGRRVCRKVHRLVAEAFIEHDETDDTVDHIRSGRDGKLDNSIDNLRWVPRSENIKKAYRDGVCDARIHAQLKDIIATDLWTGKSHYFSSIAEASEILDVNRTSISHVLRGDMERVGRYTFEYAGWEDRLLHGDEIYQCVPWV